MVDRERIELSISGCKPDVFPLALTAHKTGTVDGNQTRHDLIDSQISPSGGLYGITWYLVLGSNQ